MLEENYSRSKNMQVAIYFGMYYCLTRSFLRSNDFEVSSDPPHRYPFSMTDYILVFTDNFRIASEVKILINGIISGDGFPNILPDTLCLKGSKGLYDKIYKMDSSRQIKTDRLFKFRMLNSRLNDARKVFNIKNRDFICKEIKYTIDVNGLGKEVEIEAFAYDDND
ncbi:MAG: hypothetical protein LBK58_16030 [Prevotellaceae bacterium]|nr:hypothetical protein [Prevotellaceae bacterium]